MIHWLKSLFGIRNNHLENNLEVVVSSPKDSRDLVFAPAPTLLPSSLDLIPDVFEIEQQGSTNTCTANAACTVLEIAYKRANATQKDFSRLFAYWYIRSKSGLSTTKDQGAYPRAIGAALKQYGVCLETTWPFDRTKINTRPDVKSHDEARQLRVYEYRKLLQTLDSPLIDQIKHCIALGIPVLMTIMTKDGMYSLRGEWKTHQWNTSTPDLGLHEVVVIGYDDTSQRFLCQNSWGKYWGDGGFFGIPYDYVPKVTTEYWILSKLDVPYIPFINDGKPNLETIRDFCLANLYNPLMIAEAAYHHNVTIRDLVAATGYSEQEVRQYFINAGIEFWSII